MAAESSAPQQSSVPRQRTPWAWLIGTFGGIGLVGRGGGTVASTVVTILWFTAGKYTPTSSFALWTIAAAVVSTAIGIPAATKVARELGRKDPSEVVVDEVAGQLITFIAAPAAAGWKYALAGLILFRAFDIFKPPPVRQLERLPEGSGIMLDDVMAGIYALACLQLLHHTGLL